MTPDTFDPQQTIATIVLDHPACGRVFQRHRIDFCCGGEVSIATAAAERGIDVDVLVDELSQAVAGPSPTRHHDPRDLTTSRLVAHIVSTHHEYLRQTLPFVESLAAKVSDVHGEHQPELRELRDVVGELSAALIAHLDEEEDVLFPAITGRKPDLVAAGKHLGSMIEEHLEVATLLERIRAISRDFTLPEWACTTYRTLFTELQRVEADTFRHVHLENHVLRPRFVAA